MFTFIKNLFSSNHEKLGRRDWISLGVAGTVFTAISLGNISRWSVWFDEAFGIYLIRFNYLDVAVYTAADVHPPMYYWMLKFWSTLFGTSELALRSLSLMGMLVAILFVYLTIRKYFKWDVSVWALVLLSVSPLLIRYSEEARMYGVVAAIVAAATYVFVDLMAKPTMRKRVIYAVLIALGMWTHYFTALFWLAHAAYRFIAVREHSSHNVAKRYFSKEWIIIYVGAVLLYLPWVPLLIRQLGGVQGGGFWIPAATIGTPFGFITDIFLYREVAEATGWFALIGLVLVSLIIGAVWYGCKHFSGEQKKLFRLLVIMAAVPVILLMLASLPPLRPAFIDRYIIPSALYLLAALGVVFGYLITRKRTRTIGLIAAAFVVVVQLLGVAYVYQIGNFNKISHDTLPIQQTMQAAQALAKPGEPFVAKTVWRFYETHYYQTTDNPVYIQAEDSLTWGSYDMVRYNNYQKVQDVAEFAKLHNGIIWYLADWQNYGDPQLPPTGTWEVLQEVNLSEVSETKSTLRAVQLKLISAE